MPRMLIDPHLHMHHLHAPPPPTQPPQALVSDGSLALLEDAMRDALRDRRSVYEDSKAMLLRMFK